MNMLAEVKNLIHNQIASESRYIYIAEMIYEILLKKFNGKKITKRLETLLQEKLRADYANVPEGADGEVLKKPIVNYAREHGQCYLYIWNWEGSTYDNRLMIFIGYDSRPTAPSLDGLYLECYNPESFLKINRYDSSKESIRKCKLALERESLLCLYAERIVQYKRLRYELESIPDDDLLGPVKYGIRELAGI